MSIKRNTWFGLRKKLQSTAYGVTGRRIVISDIPESQNKLGYTAEGAAIFLNSKHPMMNDMDEKHSVMFIEGIFAHELMHQIATDFPNFKLYLEKLGKYERKIFAKLFNVLEDPAIENLASRYIGGHLLRSLSYAVMTTYKLNHDIPDAEPFTQFMTALIHYGDGGLVKGEFTSPEAKHTFYEVLPVFDKAIEELDGKKRIHYAKDVYDISRPLWQPLVEDAEAMEKLMKELEQLMEESGKCDSGGSEGPMTELKPSGEAGEVTKKKAERRKITFHKISKEEAEEMGIGKDSGFASGPLSKGDVDVYDVEDEKNSEEPNGESDAEDDVDAEKAEGSVSAEDFDDSGEIASEEYEISEVDIEILAEEIEASKNVALKEKLEKDSVRKADLDEPEVNIHYDGVSCKNINVRLTPTPALQNIYDKYVSDMATGISLLTSQLKRIFKNDVSEREYRASGRLNIKRLSGGHLTTRVFERKKPPVNKSDVAVMLLVDESGSMYGHSSYCARLAAIGLAEVFGNLKIPMSVIGYTADMDGFSAVHYHYMHWLNNPSERLKLLNINARDNNFDGYSIRYATKQFRKRKEQHKLLIVISDGSPSCRYYRNHSTGIADTKKAIEEATKKLDVIGVAIDNADTDILFSMYKKDFLHVSEVDALFNKLATTIKEKVKNWN